MKTVRIEFEVSEKEAQKISFFKDGETSFRTMTVDFLKFYANDFSPMVMFGKDYNSRYYPHNPRIEVLDK